MSAQQQFNMLRLMLRIGQKLLRSLRAPMSNKTISKNNNFFNVYDVAQTNTRRTDSAKIVVADEKNRPQSCWSAIESDEKGKGEKNLINFEAHQVQFSSKKELTIICLKLSTWFSIFFFFATFIVWYFFIKSFLRNQFYLVWRSSILDHQLITSKYGIFSVGYKISLSYFFLSFCCVVVFAPR